MPDAVAAGNLHMVDDPESDGREAEPYEVPMALLIKFDSVEEFREAIANKQCTFTVFGS